jgi:hypothetical protein
MYELGWVPSALAGGRKLAFSAMPDAPVVADAPWRERRRLRGLAERHMARRPRPQATRLAQEQACGT